MAVLPPQPPFAPGVPGATDVLTLDMPCKICGYNLRGLRVDGLCPECATPIGKSTGGDLLRYADPAWVRKIGQGLTLMLLCIVLGILLGCVGGVTGVAMQMPAIQMAVTLLVTFVGLYGTWLFTTPDPSGIGEDKDVNARKIVRVALVIGAVSTLLSNVYQSVPLPSAVEVMVIVFCVIAGLIGLVGEYFRYVFYASIGRRIPDETLVKRAGVLKWGYVIALGLALSGGLMAGVAMIGAKSPTATANEPLVWIGGGLALVGGIAYMLFALLSIFLLMRLRRRVLEQAEKADLIWKGAAVPPVVAGG